MADDLVEKVRYEADISDIQSKLRTLADKQDTLASDTDKSTSKMQGSWSKVKGLLSTGAKWFAGISAASALVIPRLLDSGVALEALGNKAKVVFSDGSLAQVQAWAKGVAGSFGMTTSQAVAMAASMGDLFKPMGFTADQAAKLATGLGDMSGALSAWSGGKQSAVEVSDTLTKALLGERDGLKALGISISEADVQARLAANGTAQLTGKQLEQAKAAATLQLIQEKSTDALKAWTDGSMDAAKDANKAKASFAQLVEVLTKGLFPVIESLLPAATQLGETLADLEPVLSLIGDTVGGVARGINTVTESGTGYWRELTTMSDGTRVFNEELHASIRSLLGVGAAEAAAGDEAKELAQNTWELAEAQKESDSKARLLARGIALADIAVMTMKGHLQQDKSWAEMQLQLEEFGESYKQLAPDSLEAQAALAGMKLSLGDFLTEMDGMPDAKVLDLVTTFDPANQGATVAAIVAWKRSLANVSLLNTSFLNESLGGGHGQPKHNGGRVAGMPGTEVLARLLPGELVLTHGQQANSGAGNKTIGTVNVFTTDSPRRFYDEGLWRVA